uniref:DDE-type integrase/transposase/recombinase n=1 Tax=Microvirga yunnanensis TaxID=2953740 RepID=UPI0035A01FE3
MRSASASKSSSFGAADQHRATLDILVQSRGSAKAGNRLLQKLLRKQGIAARVMITDKLPSYGIAGREIMPTIEHRQHRVLNNRAENSHQLTDEASAS